MFSPSILNNKLIKIYFNRVYNSVYDFTTACSNRYQILQTECIEKLQLHDNQKIMA